jgi:hypothetical protein
MGEPVEVRFKRKIGFDYETKCWPWMGAIDAYGYGQIDRCTKTHRLSWEMHRGPIPNGKCVLHTCDNPRCVSPAHLFIGTHAENNDDIAKKGRSGRRKVTDEQVREIRASTLRQQDIALKYGLHQSTVSAIVRISHFKHV